MEDYKLLTRPKDKTNFIIGERIKIARKARKMSAKTLGEKVGLHASTIIRYEKGKIENVAVDKISEFANALGVSTEWLMGIDDETCTEEVAADNYFNKIWFALQRSGFSDQEFKEIYEIILGKKLLKDSQTKKPG